MSTPFCKYIVNELLLGYFKKNAPMPGERYYIVVENKKYREAFCDALFEYSEPITISDIYGVHTIMVEEEPYETRVLRIGSDKPGIIIGCDESATEDYLTTVRNAVGVAGSKYKDYCVLYVLSDSVLSSIITASQDIQAPGFPLSSSYIIESIKKKSKVSLVRDFERAYLDLHLEKLSGYIEDGACSLFDFEKALSILEEKSLEKYFNQLEFLPDAEIYRPDFCLSNSQIRERVEKNHDTYRRIRDIMNSDDDVDKQSLLQKFLDEKLSKKICEKEESWGDVEIQAVITSEKIKAATGNLLLTDINLNNEGLLTRLVKRTKVTNKKRSTSYLIVCDRNEQCESIIKLRFNKKIPQPKKITACSISGETARIVVDPDKVLKAVFGENDNHHDVYVMRVPCESSFFETVRGVFSINNKGDVIIDALDEWDSVKFGIGEKPLEIGFDGRVIWEENSHLEVKLTGDDDEKIQFTVVFDSYELKVLIKVKSVNAVPPVGPLTIDPFRVYFEVENRSQSFEKISDGEKEYPVKIEWRAFLEKEKFFIENNCACICIKPNDFSDEGQIVAQELELPHCVGCALNRIFDYFKEKTLVPSLTPIDENLQVLYKEYLDAVVSVVDAIPAERCMHKDEYNLTKLGVVIDMVKKELYLSPFHPIVVAFMLEYTLQSKQSNEASFANKLLSPFYLIPYLSFEDEDMRPRHIKRLDGLRNWVCYEPATDTPQVRTNDITKRVVCDRMNDFIRYFNYLFQDKNCPIIISCIGIKDDTNVIEGIIEFIKDNYENGVQSIELHEYVDNLMEETFYEKLNRLDTQDAIIRALSDINVIIEAKDEYTAQEIIHQLFTKVSFYKHSLKEIDNTVGYSHVAFYLMDVQSKCVKKYSQTYRSEMAMNGLISIPSTINEDGNAYVIGFGNGAVDENDGVIHRVARVMNCVYANEGNDGQGLFSKGAAHCKRFVFAVSELMNSIYKYSNWVTFINPEVDLDFFYKQKLHIVHYTDQYSINAKYDSITVTSQMEQYENMLKNSYNQHPLSPFLFEQFNETMMKYFNCLNGSWLLGLVRKTEAQIREKMSIVAASILMPRFLKRVPDVLWIPLSLEEILRVTGAIGLTQEHIFSKKSLGAKGPMSDDLLMMGLDASNPLDLKIYLYPVEVKYSKSSQLKEKGDLQVCRTYKHLKLHLTGETTFVKNIYRTFFASQLLTAADKLHAHGLMSEADYQTVQDSRYCLLNLKYQMLCTMPIDEIGEAAVVAFAELATRGMNKELVEDVMVCNLNFNEYECFRCIAAPNEDCMNYLESDKVISVHPDVLEKVEDKAAKTEVKSTPVLEEGGDVAPPKKDVTVPKKWKTGVVNLPQEPDASALESMKIILGTSRSGSNQVVYEPNNTKLVSHPNMAIIGTMGTGKTQLVRSIIAQFTKESVNNLGQHPVGLLVFDYKGDYKDAEFLETVNGSAHKSNYPFNPLKLVVTDEVVNEGLNLPAITADRLSDSFAKAYSLGPKQQNTIKNVIVETYADYGISKSPDTWDKVPPTMDAVIEKYFEQNNDANDKAFALFDKLRDYTIFTDNQDNCVSLFEWLNQVRVIDLTLYPDDTKRVIVSLILDLFYAEMQQIGASAYASNLRELRAMIVVDEAHQFLKKDFNSLRKIVSEGRMFGVGMILSTQNIVDFRSSSEDYTQYILSWALHHVNQIKKRDLESIFGTADSKLEKYVEAVNNAKMFESVCKVGHDVYAMRDVPYFELVENDPRFSSETVEVGADNVGNGGETTEVTECVAVNDVIFELSIAGAYGKGLYKGDTFTVLKGSRLRMEAAPSCPKNALKARELNTDKINDGVLMESVSFTSPSTAAAFVAGCSLNGRTVWKTAEGKTLNDIEPK